MLRIVFLLCLTRARRWEFRPGCKIFCLHCLNLPITIQIRLLYYTFDYFDWSKQTKDFEPWFRLSNWHTGRLYAGRDFGFGVDSFGPVCQGINAESILRGQPNGERFGRLVCQELGFKNSTFIGSKSQYFSAMGIPGELRKLYRTWCRLMEQN